MKIFSPTRFYLTFNTQVHTLLTNFWPFHQNPSESIRIHQHSLSSKSDKKLNTHTDKQTDIHRYKQNNPTPGVGISYYPSSIIGTIYSSEILNYYDGTRCRGAA